MNMFNDHHISSNPHWLDLGETLKNSRGIVSQATQNYVDQLSLIALNRSKYNSLSAFAFSKLVGVSKYVRGYAETIEALDNLKVDLSLDDFYGEI